MSLTSQIEKELRGSIERGISYEEVLDRYRKRGKGPFYNALTKVLGWAQCKLSELASELKRLKEEIAQAENIRKRLLRGVMSLLT